MSKVGDTNPGTGAYNVEATTDSKYQDYVLESIIPAESDISDGDAVFKIKVSPRAGTLPPYGKLYFELSSAYSGSEDISFNGTVVPDDNDKFKAKPKGMPYIAGMSGDGIATAQAVASITSSGATLEVGVFGYKVTNKSAIVNFIKAISVEYAWVDEAS